MTRSTLPVTTQRHTKRLSPAIFAALGGALGTILFSGYAIFAQSANPGTAPVASAQAAPTVASSTTDSAQARARRRAARRRQRAAQEQAAQRAAQPSASGQVGPTAAQRARDAQILAAQKAQFNAIATENDALTQKVIEAQQKQQAEPRIQDAPGPDSTPLAGEPAVMPAQSSEPPRIQDAPGPAQTLPKAPPATAPNQSPAPQP